MITLIIARHGQTDWNRNELLAGSKDEATLTLKGRSQVRTLAKKVSAFNIDKIYCSDLKRAKQSADIIAKNLDKDITFMSSFNERNWGIHQGKPNSELGKLLDTMLVERRLEYKPQDGESQQDFENRVKKGLDQVLLDNPDKVILIMCHDGTARVLRQLLKGESTGENQKLGISNTTLDVFEISDDGRVLGETLK